jgi:hypothetical protein
MDWLGSEHVGTPTDTDATISGSVFSAGWVRAKWL